MDGCRDDREGSWHTGGQALWSYSHGKGKKCGGDHRKSHSNLFKEYSHYFH